MESRIGPVLRKARIRRELELSDVEAKTRIRARFLRAIESEEWGALPGGVYTRGFIRTYASLLGLDGDRLAEEYRRSVEGAAGGAPGRELAPVAASSATGSPGGRRSRPRLAWLAVPGVILVGAVAVMATPSDDGGGNGATEAPQATPQSETGAEGLTRTASPQGVSIRLAADAEVWVCLLDGRGEPLVEGQILEAGAEEGPFRSGSFTVALGNGEVSMLIDGAQAQIPETSSPIGFAIDSSGALTELDDAERPTCL
jgi:cytoskeleton protein RodZ